MSKNFTSLDSSLNYSVGCLNTDLFTTVEEKLYQEYPEYRETNNSFLANDKTVLRFKTVGENKIGKGYPVILILEEKEEDENEIKKDNIKKENLYNLDKLKNN